MNYWLAIKYLGVLPEMDYSSKRYVIISNIISLLISGFTFVVAIAGVAYFGMISSVKLAFVFAIVFSFPLLFNRFGFTNASRLFLSFIISASSIFISVIDKFDAQIMEEFQYFEFRLMLICASLIPFIVFRLSEKKYLISSLLFNVLCLVFYDPIHEVFHVGYYQIGLTGPNYPFMNFMFLAGFSILVSGTFFLKASFEDYENENRLLIDELSLQKKEVVEKNLLISEQRSILALENEILNKELLEKNHQLIQSNEQLVKHNNDLQQFSYTVSHNLRGPVASLLGLSNLVQEKNLDETNRVLLQHIQKSTITLDSTIKDLGNIIDIRNTISQVKQKVNIKNEIEQVVTLLQREIADYNVEIHQDLLAGDEIYSVKPMISSILYNLISNAIKYRSPNRKPVIKIRSEKMGNFLEMEVHDNGLGIDLDQHREKLFGLYKRFHTHVDGKGLGLYLVKLQVESLGGSIEIKSEVGAGSVFRICISNASEPDHQVILDKDWGKLYFDAPQNIAVVIWKRALKVDEFSEFFSRCVEFNNMQNCPNWIVEIKQGTKAEIKDEEYDRARMQFANEMKRTSLKRMGYVIAPENEPPDFEEYKKQLIAFYLGRIQFFKTRKEAEVWIENELKSEKETVQ